MYKWFAEYPCGTISEDDINFKDLKNGVIKFGVENNYFNDEGTFFVDGSKFEFFYFEKINRYDRIIQFKRAHTDITKNKINTKIKSINFGYNKNFKNKYFEVLLSIGNTKSFNIEVEGGSELVVIVNDEPISFGSPSGRGKIILPIQELIESGENDV